MSVTRSRASIVMVRNFILANLFKFNKLKQMRRVDGVYRAKVKGVANGDEAGKSGS